MGNFRNPSYDNTKWKWVLLGVIVILIVGAIILYTMYSNKKEIKTDKFDSSESNNQESFKTDVYEERDSFDGTVNITHHYLDECMILNSDRYTGNEGDSFVYKIGKHENTRGNVCTDGTSYEHGLEAWIARWNQRDEISWAYSTFELGEKYNSLVGECKLIQSYNTTDFNTNLEFWKDDKLIQSFVLMPTTVPFSFDLDVTNCKKLKIVLYDNVPKSGGTSFGLVNMELSKEQSSGYCTYEEPQLNSTGMDTNQYWVQFYEGSRNNRLEMSTFNADDFSKVIWDKKLICYGQIGECNQYYYNESNWFFSGRYEYISDSASSIVASNINIYDNSGNLVFEKTE